MNERTISLLLIPYFNADPVFLINLMMMMMSRIAFGSIECWLSDLIYELMVDREKGRERD